MGAGAREQVTRPVDAIDLRKLERETRPLLIAGFAAAVLFHCALCVVYHRQRLIPQTPARAEMNRTIRMDLIEIPARYSEPLRIREWSFKKKTLVRDRMFPIISAPDSIAGVPPPSLSLDNTVSAELNLGRQGQIDGTFEPSLPEETVPSKPNDRIPLPANIVNDTGEHTAEIIIPPGNKTAILGYVHIPIAFGERCVPPDTLRRALDFLVRAVNRYTNITAKSGRTVYLGSPDLQRYPLVYLPIDRTNPLTEQETSWLGKYLLSGGFVILDNGLPEFDTGFIGKAVRTFMVNALDSATRELKDYWVEPLPMDHLLYHCFFDFENGPPNGTVLNNNHKNNERGKRLEAFFVGNSKRLIGIYCPQGYCRSWSSMDNESQMKIGVNMAVYALSRPRAYYFIDKKRTGRSKWIPLPNQPERSW